MKFRDGGRKGMGERRRQRRVHRARSGAIKDISKCYDISILTLNFLTIMGALKTLGL